jgi:dihydrofolate reductase
MSTKNDLTADETIPKGMATDSLQTGLRKLILWNMVSLDGYFEGPEPGQLDWFRFDDELEKFMLEPQSEAGTLLFGRRTYEMMAAYWRTAEGPIASIMNRVEKIVFSRTLQQVGWNNTRLVRENVPDVVNQLKQQPGRDIFVFGSADLTATLMHHGLVDEYQFGINPVILGSGVPLLKQGVPKQDLKLVLSKTFPSGLVVLYYRPE